MNSFLKWPLLILSLIILSCSSKKNTQTSYENNELLLGSEWSLSSWTMDDQDYPMNNSEEIVLSFDTSLSRVQGNNGCNQFFGDYSIQKDKLSIQNVGATKKYCGEESAKTEIDFINFIADCSIRTLKKEELILTKDKEKLLFILKKQ